MLIIPYVCADFHDKAGNRIFRITADMLRGMQDVPEAIRQDMLFDFLVADGSIKTPENAAQRKLLEQEPMLGMSADGKEIKPEKPGKETKGKADVKTEEKPTESKTSEAEQKK